jgi:hypothetical protein
MLFVVASFMLSDGVQVPGSLRAGKVMVPVQVPFWGVPADSCNPSNTPTKRYRSDGLVNVTAHKA